MRKVWRRRARRRLLAFNAAFALVVVLPITLYGAHHVHWRWFAGVVAGGWLSTLIGLREFPPGHIERWQEGAWGEEWTAKELRPLSHEGWTVLHDRRDGPNGRANLDHVLVGPGGVFLLDSKRWHGVTTVEDGVPTLGDGMRTPTCPAASSSLYRGKHGVRRCACRARSWRRPE